MSLFKTAYLRFFDGFMEEAPTAGFFTNLFSVEPGSVSDSEKIELDLTRSLRLIATDVARGSGDSNVNFQEIYSNQEWTPPLYSEKSPITGSMLNKKLPGKTKYDPVSRMEALAILTAKAQFGQVSKIRNALEKQAIQAMTTGIITFNNSPSADFQKKATLTFTPSVKWNAGSTENPVADLVTLSSRIYRAGKKRPNVAVFKSDAWDAFHAYILAEYNNSPNWILPGRIEQSIPVDGATFQGVFAFGGFRWELYVYDDFYEQSNGTAVDYLSAETVVVFAKEARRVQAFAATEVIPFYEQQYMDLGMPMIPEIVPGMMTPFAITEGGLYYAGLQSAPLMMPVEIDSMGTIIDCLT